MRDVLIFFGVSIPALVGLQRFWSAVRTATSDSGAVLLAKYVYFLVVVELLAFFAPFLLGALVSGLVRYWVSGRALARDEIWARARIVLLLCCLGWGGFVLLSPAGEHLIRFPSFGMVLMLALVPVLVTLIYALVFPFTVRFLVARRRADD